MTHTRRLVTALTVAAVCVAAAAVTPAGAETTTTPTSTTLGLPDVPVLPEAPPAPTFETHGPTLLDWDDLQTQGGEQFEQLQNRYRSLAANLVGHYAASRNETIDTLLTSGDDTVAELIGDGSAAERLAAMGANHTFTLDAGALTEAFAQTGLSPDWGGTGSYSSMLNELSRHTTGLDAYVTAQAAGWATQLAAVHAPELVAPQLLGAATPGVPAESLVFGLFANRSIAALVADHPNVFETVYTSGLGSDAHTAAWRQSMLIAGNTLTADLTSSLPAPCLTVLIETMASGNTPADTPSDCAPCVTGGLYLHSQLGGLFTNIPDGGPGDGTVTGDEIGSYQSWLGEAFDAGTTPINVPGTGDGTGVTGVHGCVGSQTAARGALQTTLPGVFQNLGGGN